MLSKSFIKIKKTLKIITIISLCLFCITNKTYAKETKDKLVNIYLVHSENCNHCNQEIEFLNKLQNKYSNIEVYKFEITDKKNEQTIQMIEKELKLNLKSVPLTIIGDKYYIGYNQEKSPSILKTTVDYYSKYGYEDKIGQLIGNTKLPQKETIVPREDIDKYIKENSDIKIIFNLTSNSIDITTAATLLSLKEAVNIINIIILIIITIISMKSNLKNKIILYTITILSIEISQILVLFNKIHHIILMSAISILLFVIIIINIIKKQNTSNITKYISTILIMNIILTIKSITQKNSLYTLTQILKINLIDNFYYGIYITIYLISLLLISSLFIIIINKIYKTSHRKLSRKKK